MNLTASSAGFAGAILNPRGEVSEGAVEAPFDDYSRKKSGSILERSFEIAMVRRSPKL